jgi:hypothetical protein
MAGKARQTAGSSGERVVSTAIVNEDGILWVVVFIRER